MAINSNSSNGGAKLGRPRVEKTAKPEDFESDGPLADEDRGLSVIKFGRPMVDAMDAHAKEFFYYSRSEMVREAVRRLMIADSKELRAKH
jgi:hypothetical protein